MDNFDEKLKVTPTVVDLNDFEHQCFQLENERINQMIANTQLEAEKWHEAAEIERKKQFWQNIGAAIGTAVGIPLGYFAAQWLTSKMKK